MVWRLTANRCAANMCLLTNPHITKTVYNVTTLYIIELLCAGQDYIPLYYLFTLLLTFCKHITYMGLCVPTDICIVTWAKHGFFLILCIFKNCKISATNNLKFCQFSFHVCILFNFFPMSVKMSFIIRMNITALERTPAPVYVGIMCHKIRFKNQQCFFWSRDPCHCCGSASPEHVQWWN